MPPESTDVGRGAAGLTSDSSRSPYLSRRLSQGSCACASACQKSGALIVRRIQPEHPLEYLVGILELARSPQAKAESVQAPEEWPVVDHAPEKDAAKFVAQRKFSNSHSHLIVSQCLLGHVREIQVAKVSMGVEAPQVGLAHLCQQLLGSGKIASILAVVRLGYRVRKRIVGVFPRQYLLHLELRSRAAANDWFCPFFDKIAPFAPVFLCRIPNPAAFQTEWRKAKRAASIRLDLISPER